MKMEPIEGSETSAIRTKKAGNYPKENILHTEHSESLKSRRGLVVFRGIACSSKCLCYICITFSSSLHTCGWGLDWYL